MMMESSSFVRDDQEDASPSSDAGTAAAVRDRERIIALEVEGMMCQKNCGSTVKRAIEAVPGVTGAEVSFAARRAWAWHSPPRPLRHNSTSNASHGPKSHDQSDVAVGTVETESGPTQSGGGGGDDDDDDDRTVASITAEIIEAVEDVGFGAEASPDVELLVEGMMCQKNCGTTVKNALLASSPEVVRAEASFAEGRARVWTRRGRSARADGHSGAGDVAAGVERRFSSEAAAGVVAEEGGSGSRLVDGRNGDGDLGGGNEGAGPSARAVDGAAPDAASADATRRRRRRLVAAMVEALETVGFDAAPAPSAVLEIEGMMCQKSCGSTVRACLESVPGVDRAEVSYAEGRLARVWEREGSRLPVSVLVGAVEDVGFGARVVAPGEEGKGDAGKGKGEAERAAAAAAAAAEEEVASW
ncbi:unnamed protein product, partial [Scytosiphon promiscuus]